MPIKAMIRSARGRRKNAEQNKRNIDRANKNIDKGKGTKDEKEIKKQAFRTITKGKGNPETFMGRQSMNRQRVSVASKKRALRKLRGK